MDISGKNIIFVILKERDMITRTEFEEAYNEFQEKMKFLADELEDLWQRTSTSSNPEVRELNKRIENIQFHSFTNPLFILNVEFIRNIKETIDYNEKVKDLDKLNDYERFVNMVRSAIKNLDK